MKWKHLKIVAFDTETTGLDPYSGDRIIEVGLVILTLDSEAGVIDRQDYSRLINPGIPIPKKITQITGIRDDDVVDQPMFEEVAEEIGALFDGAIAVAHNFPFDYGFFQVEFQKAGVDWIEPFAAIDTIDLSIKLFPEARSHKLGDVAKRMDVPLENAHRATDDAAACGYIFAQLAQKHSVPDDLQELLDWANAIGRPPEEGPLGVDSQGRTVFKEGPHIDELVSNFPLHLAWMEKAKQKGPHGWTFRFPETTRSWVRRWMDVRGSGRAKQNGKSFRRQDWVIDPCIAEPRKQR